MRNREYFEGWYVKLQRKESVIACIPGYHCMPNGKREAFIQVIWKEKSYYIRFPYSHCSFGRNRIRIGTNIFTRDGVKLDLKGEGIAIQGLVRYHHIHKLSYSIMGIFALIPGMQCRHRVMSMGHALCGDLKINGKWVTFHGGTGYMEGDQGTSFPSCYTWVQCNQFPHQNASIMVSAASIPMMGRSFTGCIAAVSYQGKEYRLATYLGAKVIHWGKDCLWIKQGKKQLIVELAASLGQQLMAPVKGRMNRKIQECLSGEARFYLEVGNQKIFDLTSEQVSFEQCIKENKSYKNRGNQQ